MKLVLHEDSVLTGVHFSGIQDQLRMTLGSSLPVEKG